MFSTGSKTEIVTEEWKHMINLSDSLAALFKSLCDESHTMATSNLSPQYFKSMTLKHSYIRDYFVPFTPMVYRSQVCSAQFTLNKSEYAKIAGSSQKPLNVLGCHLNYDFENKGDGSFYSDSLHKLNSE